ncbi:MAG: acetyl-CoA carboxylase carboxyltransferase subunit alpha [Maricaulaceae bacterium]
MAAHTVTYLDFEKPVAELEGKIAELEALHERDDTADVAEEVERLRGKAKDHLSQLYGHLDAWRKTQVARHPHRPHFSYFRDALITDFVALAGDRGFAEDHAIQGGLGWLRGRSVVVLGHEKGEDTESRLKHNFGMARPEGYRKAVRLMTLAEDFGLPVVAFVDTAGAYPGIGAEERGQAQAIAKAIDRGLSLNVPFVAVVTGEGGSGGAVALASADQVLMLEHAVYSVISPEGCASILWRDAAKAKEAANAMKITAQDLEKFKIVDTIVPEPMGGAHRDRSHAAEAVGDAIEAALDALVTLSPGDRKAARRERFLRIGREGL